MSYIDAQKKIDESQNSKELSLTIMGLNDKDLERLIDKNQNFFSKLETLNLKFNQLRTLPDNIDKLQNIKNLNLSLNQLEELPEKIDKLQQLESLNLDANSFKELPIGICKLANLHTLNINSNVFLTDLPTDINALTNLKYLDLSNNHMLRNIPNGLFNQLNNLEEFILIGNCFSPEIIDDICNNLSNTNVILNSPINWKEGIFNKLQFSNNTRKDIIESAIGQNQPLQEFLSKAESSSLYSDDSTAEIVLHGLERLFLQLCNDDKKESIVSEIIAHSTDCSTPVSDLITRQYILFLQENNQPIPNALIARLAMSNYIETNHDQLFLQEGEKIEQKEGLLNSLFLDNRLEYEDNKLKFLNVPYSWPSNTENIEYAFSQITENTAEAFLKMVSRIQHDHSLISKDDYYQLDTEKIEVIVENYRASVLGIKSEFITLINEAYDGFMTFFEEQEYDYETDPCKFFTNGYKKDMVIQSIIEKSGVLLDNDRETNVELMDKLYEKCIKELSQTNYPFYDVETNQKDTAAIPDCHM
ncbi:hypothetical protein L3V83_07795 [Thiotrichales bacterium 19X7-9]|nr:hypothetical protein [Thiotrichales bacterium 19X7-9]